METVEQTANQISNTVNNPALRKYDYIPSELKEKGQFCVWKKEIKEGKPTKVPYNPRTGGYAQVNNPATFSSFEVALNALNKEEILI